MKILKIIIGVIVALIAVILIAAIFIKKDYIVTREVVISKPNQQVFDYIKYLKNQDNYSIWVMQDPNMKKGFRGTDGTPGFVYAWDGNDEAGKGEQELKSIVEGQSTDVEIRFSEPFEGLAQARMTTGATSATSTKVTWTFASHINYPMNFMVLFTDGMMGGDMEKSLQNLKAILEKP